MWCNQRRGRPCTWPPDHLQGMMVEWFARRARHEANWNSGKYFNELVLNTTALAARLPLAIEAFFFVPNAECTDPTCVKAGYKCARYARDAHAAFLRRFALQPTSVPLLRLNVSTGEFECAQCDRWGGGWQLHPPAPQVEVPRVPVPGMRSTTHVARKPAASHRQ